MRLVSYNVRKAVGLDGRHDPMRVLRVLREIGGDVVILQECDRRLGRRPAALPPEMIDGETEYEVLDHAGSEVSLGWHGNAILLRRGLTSEALGRIDLPGLEPRGAVAARIGGLTVVGTHLGLLRSSRHEQMRTIRDWLAAGSLRRALVAGDFNEWSEARGFGPWRDAFQVRRPGRSFHARRPLLRLDGFAAGHDVEVVAEGIHDAGEARVASDHLPVWADIRVATEAGPKA